MNSTFKNMFRWQYVVGFLLVWATLTAVNLHWLVDNWYQHSFNENVTQSFVERLRTINYLRDPAYFLIQAVLSQWLSFNGFFGLLIFFCLALKFSALLQVNSRPGILDVAPYLLVLGFLHEGIQMRIAIALSIAIWAIVIYAKNRRLLALVILAIACTFHITASTFFIVFILSSAYKRFGLKILIIGAICSGALAYTEIVPELLLQVGAVVNARYLSYSQSAFTQIQNKSGLFQYFFLLPSFLTLFICFFYKSTSEVWRNLKIIGVTSGLLAISILQIFRFSVVTSSRLADLLLLPVVLVLGATLSQLYMEKKYWLLFLMCISLLLYCAVRSYVSFNQAPLKIT